MTRVGIVCDSTCDLGPEYLASRSIRMVPLKVLFPDGTSYLDWSELVPETFFELLKNSPGLPKTSQPSPADFLAVYADLAAEGCEEIVSIHLTSALSGTFQSATIAAQDSPVPIRVIDTKLVSQATGLVVKGAARARDEGGDAAAVEAAARAAMESCRLFFILDTLDYLVKGGRAGKAQGLAASLLNIKPVLTFNADGIIEPFLKVKGTKKAIAALAEHVAEASKTGRVHVSLLHAIAPEAANELKAALDASGADYRLESIGEVGAVIGTYAGPGAIGLAWTYHDVG